MPVDPPAHPHPGRSTAPDGPTPTSAASRDTAPRPAEASEEEPAGPSYAVEESALRHDCELWFAVPASFVDLPLDALADDPPSPRTEEFTRTVDALLALVPEEGRARFLGELAQARFLPAALRQSGLAHCALGLHEVTDGEVVPAVLTLVWREAPWTPPKLTAARIVVDQPAAQSQGEVLSAEYVELPCGPGAVTETVTEHAGQRVYQAAGHLPHPDGRRLVIVTLSSTAVEARAHYRELLDGLVHLVSFDNPLPDHLRARMLEPEETASARATFG